MKYSKPEVAVRGSAVENIHTSILVKSAHSTKDNLQSQVPVTEFASSAAYEADE